MNTDVFLRIISALHCVGTRAPRTRSLGARRSQPASQRGTKGASILTEGRAVPRQGGAERGAAEQGRAGQGRGGLALCY